MIAFFKGSLQAIVILALASAGVLIFIFTVFLLSLIDRFKKRGVYLFLGVMIMINGIIVASIIVLYTLLYAKDAKMSMYRKFIFVFL